MTHEACPSRLTWFLNCPVALARLDQASSWRALAMPTTLPPSVADSPRQSQDSCAYEVKPWGMCVLALPALWKHQ